MADECAVPELILLDPGSDEDEGGKGGADKEGQAGGRQEHSAKQQR